MQYYILPAAIILLPIIYHILFARKMASVAIGKCKLCETFRPWPYPPAICAATFTFGCVEMQKYAYNFIAVYERLVENGQIHVFVASLTIIPMGIAWMYNKYLTIFSALHISDGKILYVHMAPHFKIETVHANEIIDVIVDRFAVAFFFDRSITILTSSRTIKIKNIGNLEECMKAIMMIRRQC